MKKIFSLLIIILSIAFHSIAQFSKQAADSLRTITDKDHKRMMKILGIDSLRPGANGSDPNAPNAVNYDESKANPYPGLPDPLTLKNGNKVTTAREWWLMRRP